MVGGSADAVTQPGAMVGQETYCPISGVVFAIKDTTPSVVVGGQRVFFCCAGCAAHFEANREQVIARRGLSASTR